MNAEAHIRRGRLDDAVDSYNSILKNFHLPDKELQEVHLALGQVLTNMSLLDQAERSFEHAASVRAETPLPHYCLGVVHTKQGRFDDALKSYETALFFDPSFFPAIHNIGSLYIILDKMDQARYYFQVCVSLRRLFAARGPLTPPPSRFVFRLVRLGWTACGKLTPTPSPRRKRTCRCHKCCGG